METVATPFIGDAECGPISAGPAQMPRWSKTPRTIFILSILFLASLVSALDSTIVTTLTHTIMSDLESPLVVSWLGASYLIATALVQPLCGQFSDIYTRRACLLVGSVAFFLGNVTCGMAESLSLLVFGRALSGIGGGILTIMTTIVLTDVTHPGARGVWQGINNIVFGFGHGSGGLFGGLVAHRWSWRVAFVSFSVPAFLVMLGATLLPEPVRRPNQITTTASTAEESIATGNEDVPLLPKLNSPRRKVDAVGTILLCLGLGLLLASSEQLELCSSNLDLRLVSFGFVISFIMLAIFTYHSVFMTQDALLPLPLLIQSPSVGYSCLITFLSQFGFTISEFYLPYFISLQEHTEMEVIGWCLVPLSVGAAAGSFFAGSLTSRFDTSHLLLGSSAVSFIGTLGVPLTLHGTYALTYQLVFIFLWGFGFGGLATASLLRMLDSIEKRWRDRKTGKAFYRTFVKLHKHCWHINQPVFDYQGNSGRWLKDNGVFQDGGLVFQFEDHWGTVFIGLASQAVHTEDGPERAGYPLPDHDFITWADLLAPEQSDDGKEKVDIEDSPVFIVQALLIPPGPDQQPGTAPETISLKNRTGNEVDLSGWKIRIKTGDTQTLPSGTRIGAAETNTIELASHFPTMAALSLFSMRKDSRYMVLATQELKRTAL
ncbi:hypothetical protein FCOIX_5252 [Fusarium coicis]|nr:hypothetical protein FCOIX_5252 [Fusarium coicis]